MNKTKFLENPNKQTITKNNYQPNCENILLINHSLLPATMKNHKNNQNSKT